MSGGWSLRLARDEDAEGFHGVEEDAAGLLREEPGLRGVAIPPSGSAEHYRRLIRKRHCLTVVAQDRVIGFAAAAPERRELHLHELSVARAHQRRGIGATLLQALAIDARNAGFCAITLETWRHVPFNAPFYARYGFVELENREGRRHLSGAPTEADENRCAMIRFLD